MKHKLSNYGNSDAHNQIKKLMLRGEKLTIGFFNEETVHTGRYDGRNDSGHGLNQKLLAHLNMLSLRKITFTGL